MRQFTASRADPSPVESMVPCALGISAAKPGIDVKITTGFPLVSIPSAAVLVRQQLRGAVPAAPRAAQVQGAVPGAAEDRLLLLLFLPLQQVRSQPHHDRGDGWGVQTGQLLAPGGVTGMRGGSTGSPSVPRCCPVDTALG